MVLEPNLSPGTSHLPICMHANPIAAAAVATATATATAMPTTASTRNLHYAYPMQFHAARIYVDALGRSQYNMVRALLLFLCHN